MGTTHYYPSLDASSTVQFVNGTYLDYSEQLSADTIDHPTHLFVLISIWVVLLVTIILGTTGNILVLYVYINRKDKKTCTFFIKMLAVVDLIICSILAPLELYQVTTGIRNELLCKFYGFLSTHVLYSTFLITIIAFDRYFCICWPLYKIITVHRAHAVVIICGLLSSLLAIIPMNEYSTLENVLRVHSNDSEHFLPKSLDGFDATHYKHVEQMKATGTLPHVLNNVTTVSCSPKFSFRLTLAKFISVYRTFHSALFAVCILLVLILYAFIYQAVYQRRVTRTRKFSAYRRIIRSYLINNEAEQSQRRSSKSHRRHRRHRHHHYHHDHNESPSTLTLICCYCCKINDDYGSDSQRPSESALTAPLNERHRQSNRRHHHDEASSVITHQNRNKPQVVLEVNGARGKRYSAISMTSMTYLTSGVWDETSSTNLIRSRINSIAATTYCGTENSSTSRPSTSTEDSFEQATRLATLNNTLLQLRPTLASHPTHLTVPGQQATTSLSPPPSPIEGTAKESPPNEEELPRSVSQCTNLLHPSYVRKASNALLVRQQSRPSDASIPQRKVSFMTVPDTTIDRRISGDASSTCPRASLTPSNAHPQQHHLTVQMSPHRSLSTASSIDHTNPSDRKFSIVSSSARRLSTFDCETQRTLERQQTQERLANIRTTFTLFIVTSTFIVMYLPSVIHTLFEIGPHSLREVLFLLYYVNSACNPLIYSFFNVNFRNDIRRLYECQKREYLARRY